ncbi:MAG: nitroreductase family protein [Candidatus Cloacimonas sp.]|nr:nitroreductase family protein [Candidatus Cloacimonadota bacterium]
MEFLDVIKSRKSVRNYSSEPVPEEILNEILEAGRNAPSYQNRQCWRFVVINEPDRIKEFANNTGLVGKINYFIKDAPLIIVACADPLHSGTMNKQNYYLVDTAIAFQQMMLTAWNYGVGSCWMAGFNEKVVKKHLNLPSRIRVVAFSPFGYPKDRETTYGKFLKVFSGSKARSPLEKLVHYNKWGKKG